MNIDSLIKYLIWAVVFAIAIFGIRKLMISLGAL